MLSNDFRRMLHGLLPVCLIAVSSGCYHTHLITSGGPTTSGASAFPATLSAGSVVPPPPSAIPNLSAEAACPVNGLYSVQIDSTLGYAAGTVFSFGKWSRVQVAWKCAKSKPRVGPALPGMPRPPTPPTPAGAAAAEPPTSTTVHRLLWGLPQKDLTPPANPAVKTPANCKSEGMRHVTIPKNYGYALITVLTLGIWAPLEVQWQCAETKTSAAASVPSKEAVHAAQ